MKNRVWVIALAVLCCTGLAFAQNTARDEAGAPQTTRSLAAPAVVSQPINTPPQGAVVYDNGPLVTHPGGGAGGADASALQTSQGMTIFGFGQQQAANNRVADDFTIPAGQSWRLESVTLWGYQTGSGTTSSFTGVNIQIWNGVPGAPGSTVVFGDTTTNRLVSSTFSNIYRALDTTLTDPNRPIMKNIVSLGVTLAAGTYWLDWQSNGTLASGPWAPPISILGQTTTGNSMQQVAGGAWAALVDVGPQGLPFQLNILAPAALVLTGGNANGVWEPAETANFETAWKGGALNATAVTGTATADATMTLTDNAASYGNIAANATVSCTANTNCYAGTASGPRPGTHWDAVMTETLSTGDVKAWKLHVGSSFTDVPMTNGFYRFVETLLHKGVTGGCGTATYCPSNAATREQMAPFVLVAKEGSSYSPVACGATPMFADVPATSGFCKWIEELARRGVVSGCAPSLYCPTDPVTRAQMSIFTLRTLDPALSPPACGTPMFADVPASNPFCKWIEELARRGVVTGCGSGNYCPNDSVTRDQMAVFISATFGLTLYGI